MSIFALLFTALFVQAIAQDDCTARDGTKLCFQQRVRFAEGLIVFGVLLTALLLGLTCLSALNTPTRFEKSKNRDE